MNYFFLSMFLILFSIPGFSREFKFDSELAKCLDVQGNAGLNPYVPDSVELQCTDFRDKHLVYVTIKNSDLRGSVFGNNHTYGGACEILLSDLRHSTFHVLREGSGYRLDDSDLRNANLAEIELTYKYSGSKDLQIIVSLSGAKFNKGTILPKFEGKQITEEEAVSKFGMLYLE